MEKKAYDNLNSTSIMTVIRSNMYFDVASMNVHIDVIGTGVGRDQAIEGVIGSGGVLYDVYIVTAHDRSIGSIVGVTGTTAPLLLQFLGSALNIGKRTKLQECFVTGGNFCTLDLRRVFARTVSNSV